MGPVGLKMLLSGQLRKKIKKTQGPHRPKRDPFRPRELSEAGKGPSQADNELPRPTQVILGPTRAFFSQKEDLCRPGIILLRPTEDLLGRKRDLLDKKMPLSTRHRASGADTDLFRLGEGPLRPKGCPQKLTVGPVMSINGTLPSWGCSRMH